MNLHAASAPVAMALAPYSRRSANEGSWPSPMKPIGRQDQQWRRREVSVPLPPPLRMWIAVGTSPAATTIRAAHRKTSACSAIKQIAPACFV